MLQIAFILHSMTSLRRAHLTDSAGSQKSKEDLDEVDDTYLVRGNCGLKLFNPATPSYSLIFVSHSFSHVSFIVRCENVICPPSSFCLETDQETLCLDGKLFQ